MKQFIIICTIVFIPCLMISMEKNIKQMIKTENGDIYENDEKYSCQENHLYKIITQEIDIPYQPGSGWMNIANDSEVRSYLPVFNDKGLAIKCTLFIKEIKDKYEVYGGSILPNAKIKI